MAGSEREHQNPERDRLHEMMAVGAAEWTVADVRMADLAAEQTAAWRRHRAAKGLVTRALKDGSADKIAAAHERERRAYAEGCETADAGIDEMFMINRAGLERFGEILAAIGPPWAVDSAQPGETPVRDAEAGS
jgi:hypothetical protein